MFFLETTITQLFSTNWLIIKLLKNFPFSFLKKLFYSIIQIILLEKPIAIKENSLVLINQNKMLLIKLILENNK